MKNTPEKKCKKIKDPIYGYITIEENYIKNIIDTPVFQRLRRVMQTSYSPLYSSALHNRFVHSLGVYHLGTIVSERLEKSLKEQNIIDEEIVDNLTHVYKLACLLHDVGHAPFSHTGEIFYKHYMENNEDQYKAKKLHERLCQLVNSEAFKKDLPIESKSTAPHEIMSAIIGIKNFRDFIGDEEDCEFFARCITGYTYKSYNPLNNVRNCFVGMLNSKVIDVDRLDYLIRDAYTSGFETVNIDYNRLLNAITVKEYLDNPRIVYRKDAVSVIENVVYAHDAEKKWIQNHPVVLYEAFIIKHILENIGRNLDKKDNRLFSENALSVEGCKLKGGIHISLLCDDDIIYLAKNMYSDEISKELFDRNKRRHPVWKSEAEYRAYIRNNATSEDHRLLTMCMLSFVKGIPEFPAPTLINEETLAKCKEELEESYNNPNINGNACKRKYNLCQYLYDYAVSHGFPCDYMFLPANMFTSNFSKDYMKKTLINIDGNEPVEFHTVCNILNAESNKENSTDNNTKNPDMYYLYYRSAEPADGKPGKIENVKEFCNGLLKTVKVTNPPE